MRWGENNMIDNAALTTCVAAFADELARNGLKHAVISPGSRSTPLTILFNEHPEINTYINIDERSAAFFALGLAKATHQPTALICTSGTAAANYFPAIVEAKLSRIPLLVLTSDRPHELRQVGAPQSIDQIKLFGDHVKSFTEMPVPDGNDLTSKGFRSQARRMMMATLTAPKGPVHINLPFREPLVPNVNQPNLWENHRLTKPFNSGYGETSLSENEVIKLEEILETMQKGLIIVGPETTDETAELFAEVGKKYSLPILADPLSQLRTGPHNKAWIIETYDAFLRDPEIKSFFTPDVILRFGAMPVSKSLLQFLTNAHPAHYAIFDSGKEWLDPTHQVTDMFYTDTVQILRKLLTLSNNSSPHQAAWAEKWKNINEAARQTIITSSADSEWYEGQAVKELICELPEDATLFVGNSMPIRDLDTYLLNQDKRMRTLANRGANGIDGVVSSALGVAAVKGNAYLLIGDLSFFHDMNGLLIAKKYKIDLTIIVINNNGGGIFSFLPQADTVTDFENLFGTPADLDFSLVAQLYGAAYFHTETWDAYRSAISKRHGNAGLKIIEIKTDREQNTELHRALWRTISNQVKGCIDHEKFS